MKMIDNLESLLEDVNAETRGFLEYALKYPETPIPIYPKNDSTPSEAEKEAREQLKELRMIELNYVDAMPYLKTCHVEREGIWVDFTLNPKFVQILIELGQG